MHGDIVLRHISLYTNDNFYLTHPSSSARSSSTVEFDWISRMIRRSNTRSAIRKVERPAATITKGSSAAMLVHPAGTDQSCSASS